MTWVLFVECGKWFGLGRIKKNASFPGFCLGALRFSWGSGTVAEAISSAVLRHQTAKTLDEICAEKRARDAEEERKRPRGRHGWFTEKGVR
jgi:hypothetical protein